MVRVEVWSGGESAEAPAAMDIAAGTTTAGGLLEVYLKSRGVEAKHHRHFALYLDGADFTHRLDPASTAFAEIQGRLVVRKTTLMAAEEKVMLSSDGASTLLFEQAVADVDSGRLQATDAQLDQLDELADPAFQARRQYVELAQTLPGYETIQMHPCELTIKVGTGGCGAELQQQLAARGLQDGVVDVLLTRRGIALTPSGREPILLLWQKIRCWSQPTQAHPERGDKSTFSFELVGAAPDSSIWLHLCTREGLHLLECVTRVVTHLKQDLDGPEWPEDIGQEAEAAAAKGSLFNALFSRRQGSGAAAAEPSFTSLNL